MISPNNRENAHTLVFFKGNPNASFPTPILCRAPATESTRTFVPWSEPKRYQVQDLVLSPHIADNIKPASFFELSPSVVGCTQRLPIYLGPSKNPVLRPRNTSAVSNASWSGSSIESRSQEPLGRLACYSTWTFNQLRLGIL